MKIFLDDIREPYDNTWVVTRNMATFRDAVLTTSEPIIEMSFDHDLGENEPTGHEATKWFIEMVLDNPALGRSLEKVYAHSDNPPGRDNIAGYFESARAHGVLPASMKVIRRPFLSIRRQ